MLRERFAAKLLPRDDTSAKCQTVMDWKLIKLLLFPSIFFFLDNTVEYSQTKLYPTVGLQTPGEIVDANFGQEPFKFDIEDMLKELRASTKASIYNFPITEDQGDWTVILHK